MRDGPSRRWILGRVLRSGLLRPRALFALAAAMRGSGTSLVALTRFGGAQAGAMLIDEDERVALRDLADQADRLAMVLQQEHGIQRGQPVGILGANSVALVRCLLAASRLGARTILLNQHLPADRIGRLLDRHAVAFVLAPGGATDVPLPGGCTVCDPTDLLRLPLRVGTQLRRRGSGEIVVLTGGTTGLPKAANRAASPPGVTRLFLHLIAALPLERSRSVHVAVPLFHGFGLSALLIAMTLGRTIHLRQRFDAAEAAALIVSEGIDTIVVVPTMLQRLLNVTAGELPLRCVVTGGAPLASTLANATRDRFGEILFNLYGTSEAGLSALATPRDLASVPNTIGRPVWGAEIAVRGADGAPIASGEVGELHVRNRASIAPRDWIATGDRASRDRGGRMFLHGRVDDMIVSGGENVAPLDVESVLLTHPDVADAVAVGVADAEYGQRLLAFVVPCADRMLDADDVLAWLTPRVARHQRPRRLVIRAALPLTAIGKVDRRALVREGS